MIPSYVEETHKQFWPQFENWCRNNGVGEDPVDRETFWDCFIAGATAMFLKVKKGDITV